MLIRASRIGVAGLAVAACMVSGQGAQAGLLSSNSGGAIPGYTGSILFSGDSFTDYGIYQDPINMIPYSVSANVDYAVFAPGAFGVAFPGQDPSGGTEYVYAYQIENLDTDISKLTVGLDGDEPLGTVGFLATGLTDPTASSFIGAGPTSAAWDFTVPGALTNGNSSAVLIFTSAAAPEWDTATVAAAWSNTQNLPSPVPEPASLGLIAVGLGLVSIRRKH